MPEVQARRAVVSPLLCVALSALFWPRTGMPALPPGAPAAPAETGSASPAAASGGPGPGASDAGGGTGIVWALPPIRWGGSISYDMRSNSGEGQKNMQRGLMTTLKGATETFVWQPWFSRLNLDLNLTAARSSTSWSGADGESGGGSGSRSLSLSGSGQLNLLPLSRFPFEAHVSRTDSTVSSDLSLPADYVSTRLGFSQRYIRPGGDAMFGYDHGVQNSSSTGGDRQDIVRLAFNHNLQNQRFQLTGNGSSNTRDRTGEYARQGSMTLQHYYSPDLSLSVDSMANVSTTNYYLSRSQSNTNLNQLSTQAFWRPEGRPMTVFGGARLVTMSSGGSSDGLAQESASVRSGNVNAGLGYEASRHLRLNASANLNMTESRDRRNVNGTQSASASYQPDSRQIGGFLYNWNASAGVANQTGENGGHQLTLQLSHNLSRNFILKEGSTVGTDLSQSVTVMKNSRRGADDLAPTRMLTHTGGVSWSRSEGAAVAMARLSVSDSRGLDGNQEYFQMLNLQLSGTLQTGSDSSWTGNLTVQATRQGVSDAAVPPMANDSGLSIAQLNARRHAYSTMSSGALTYQSGKFFGIRNLRFVSDLRLNSQALLPVLGGPQDQETAAWENRFIYTIGRTQLRVSTIIARAVVPSYTRGADGTEHVEGVSRTNKSIMFSLMRTFGYY